MRSTSAGEDGGAGFTALEGGSFARWAAAPLLAITFLTTIPVPAPGRVPAGAMGAATALFPLVGAGLGLLVAMAAALLGAWLPQSVAAAVVLGLLLLLSGALHLDGLMDSFDGLFGGKDRESRLAIMRDSRVGSYGIAAAGSILLLEYAGLAALADAERGVAVVVAATLSRWATGAALSVFPAASTTGLAAGLKPEMRRHHLLIATATAVAVVLLAAGPSGAWIAAAALAITALGGRFAANRLGGITGDTCGALGQLVEVSAIVLATALP